MLVSNTNKYPTDMNNQNNLFSKIHLINLLTLKNLESFPKFVHAFQPGDHVHVITVKQTHFFFQEKERLGIILPFDSSVPLPVTSYNIQYEDNDEIEKVELERIKAVAPKQESTLYTKTFSEIYPEEYDKSLIVFVSHRWLRSNEEHPDNENNDHFQLCIHGIEKLWKQLAPTMENCYLWIDYCCLDPAILSSQREEYPKILKTIFQITDCMFTPIEDECHTSRIFPNVYQNILEEYPSPSFSALHGSCCTKHVWCPGFCSRYSNESYLKRGCCRLEMLFNAVLPIWEYNSNERIHEKLEVGLRKSALRGKRPHFLYGSYEHANHFNPIALPTLDYSFVLSYPPMKGVFPNKNERSIVLMLLKSIKELIQSAEGRYKKQRKTLLNSPKEKEIIGTTFLFANDNLYRGTMKNGTMNGRGILFYANGERYEGDFINNQKHGQGFHEDCYGNRYLGEWYENQRHGKGTLKMRNGFILNGNWFHGKLHGFCHACFPNGNQLQIHMKHGLLDGPGLQKMNNNDEEGAGAGGGGGGSYYRFTFLNDQLIKCYRVSKDFKLHPMVSDIVMETIQQFREMIQSRELPLALAATKKNEDQRILSPVRSPRKDYLPLSPKPKPKHLSAGSALPLPDGSESHSTHESHEDDDDNDDRDDKDDLTELSLQEEIEKQILDLCDEVEAEDAEFINVFIN